eukprot:1739370-Amphidinium_carterae.2
MRPPTTLVDDRRSPSAVAPCAALQPEPEPEESKPTPPQWAIEACTPQDIEMPYWSIEASAWQLYQSTLPTSSTPVQEALRESSTPTQPAPQSASSGSRPPQWAIDACTPTDIELPDWCIEAKAWTLYRESMQTSSMASQSSAAAATVPEVRVHSTSSSVPNPYIGGGRPQQQAELL